MSCFLTPKNLPSLYNMMYYPLRLFPMHLFFLWDLEEPIKAILLHSLDLRAEVASTLTTAHRLLLEESRLAGTPTAGRHPSLECFPESVVV